ncbi:hypothetical protein FV218_10375 [Methylobacterium sp. WL69]|uniref:protealysin inhibitor emfourin n=1 Tax=Methylobacterium sp. WL69 TaxID=2603893 RepID=UPI0011C8C551|nr:protealysin inhibitor emfourin [Methylobacterium sp. WL69]TXM74203.1 hypothetical protein FV218_10375 [Methylobacterium sp. WL69]
MRVSLRQSGGWGGLRLCCSLDTKTLSAEERLIVERTVRTPALFKPSNRLVGGADVAHFEVEFRDEDGTHLMGRFKETDDLPAAQTLLRIMRPHLRPQPRARQR